jgi:hypothetical protein
MNCIYRLFLCGLVVRVTFYRLIMYTRRQNNRWTRLVKGTYLEQRITESSLQLLRNFACLRCPSLSTESYVMRDVRGYYAAN